MLVLRASRREIGSSHSRRSQVRTQLHSMSFAPYAICPGRFLSARIDNRSFSIRSLQRSAMDAYIPKAWKLGQAAHQRRVLARASLEKARKARDVELERLARSPKTTDSAEAYDLVKAFALPASPNNIALAQDWDRANASYWP